MKFVKIIIKILAAIVIIVTIAGSWFYYSHKPLYEGQKDLSGLENTSSVYFDTYGVPHIYGESKLDAFRSLGYVHAQDRLWQMELLRRIAAGGLSEVFGKDVLNTDKFFLALGIDEASKKTVAELDVNAESVRLSQAYLDGINQFVENGATPIEFYLTGIAKAPFTLKDIHNTMGYMAFSFAQAHKTDPLLTNIKNKLGTAYLEDLEVDVDLKTELIQSYNDSLTTTLSETLISVVTKTLDSLRIPLFEGSNSWVLGPDKTKNGKVIFANDPHIGFSQPSVWYEAHVVAPDYEKYGYHIAGIPFPLLAHDKTLAYGMTMFENDDIDFYYEETHPSDSTHYKTENGWEPYAINTHQIKVKDTETVEFKVKQSKRGPLLNGIADQITGERPVAMWWAYTNHKNELMQGLFEMATANNIASFKSALKRIHAPGLNMMYGDAEGNIGWWASAKLYSIPDSVHTKFLQSDSRAFPANKKYLDFSQNPQAVNPPWKYVYSANNQPDSINGRLFPGYYLPENRARRIVDLLAPKNDWDAKAVQEMITDVRSPVNTEILNKMIAALKYEALAPKQQQIVTIMKQWDGDYPLHSVPATVYHRWVYRMLANTFADELGEEWFDQFLTTHFSKRTLPNIVKKPNSIWWDDIKTENTTESLQTIVQTSFEETIMSLNDDFGNAASEWTWDKVHTIEHGHPIGQVAALRSFFNVGPFAVNGTREVINNMSFGYTADGLYKVSSGPSTRRVVDFSNVANSMSILPTGQSGNPFSVHYKDQAAMYVNGEFRKMLIDKSEIRETSTLLELKPIK